MKETEKEMTELEKANQRIKELEAQMMKVAPVDPVVIVLANGDLHRGMGHQFKSQDNVENIPIEHQHPMNKAMAQILQAAKGNRTLTCLWCGLQEDGALAEKSMREHLKTNHPSVVTQTADAEVLMLNLAEAQRRLAEANV